VVAVILVGLKLALLNAVCVNPVSTPKLPVPPAGVTFKVMDTVEPSLHTKLGLAAQLTVGKALTVTVVVVVLEQLCVSV